MQTDNDIGLFRQAFDGRAVVTISMDTEQIWGYLDLCTQEAFAHRYPGAMPVCDKLLELLRTFDVRATWAVVGGLTLSGSTGQSDERFQGLPPHWTAKITAGTEASNPLWYRRSFFRQLCTVLPKQDIGLHGGLTHLIWDDPLVNAAEIQRELSGGVDALADIGVSARSFVYPRNRERLHRLLVDQGFTCYRGRSPVHWETMRSRVPRALLRVVEEVFRFRPPVIWPEEHLPGLWNIPCSLALYPMRRLRSTMVPLGTRLRRFSLGIETAVASAGIFHFCLHPDNLAESSQGLQVFESLLEELDRWRKSDGVLVLPMADIAETMTATNAKNGMPGRVLSPPDYVTRSDRVERSSAGHR